MQDEPAALSSLRNAQRQGYTCRLNWTESVPVTAASAVSVVVAVLMAVVGVADVFEIDFCGSDRMP